jgi:hypothetical protein
MQVNQPTAEQIKAIITWADRMGRFWRRELHSAWMDGNYQGNRDISSGLQQVRNQFGPEWLVKFNLKAAKAAQAAPEPVLEQITGPVEPSPASVPAPQAVKRLNIDDIPTCEQIHELFNTNVEFKAQAGESTFTYQGRTVTISPDFKGTHGWRWYIDIPSTGQSLRSERAYLLEERAIFEAKLHIDQIGN